MITTRSKIWHITYFSWLTDIIEYLYFPLSITPVKLCTFCVRTRSCAFFTVYITSTTRTKVTRFGQNEKSIMRGVWGGGKMNSLWAKWEDWKAIPEGGYNLDSLWSNQNQKLIFKDKVNLLWGKVRILDTNFSLSWLCFILFQGKRVFPKIWSAIFFIISLYYVNEFFYVYCRIICT